MADGVTKIGGGWDIAVAGTAEYALEQLLAAGALTGEDVITALKSQGFGDRGPAYYPAANGSGPFYALGNPHTYAAIDTVGGAQQWDLLNPTGAALPVEQPAAPAAPPAPRAPDTASLVAQLDALMASVSSSFANVAAQLTSIKADIEAHDDANTQKVLDCINQVVKNAEASARALAPIAEAVIPSLSGLLGKTPATGA